MGNSGSRLQLRLKIICRNEGLAEESGDVYEKPTSEPTLVESDWSMLSQSPDPDLILTPLFTALCSPDGISVPQLHWQYEKERKANGQPSRSPSLRLAILPLLTELGLLPEDPLLGFWEPVVRRLAFCDWELSCLFSNPLPTGSLLSLHLDCGHAEVFLNSTSSLGVVSSSFYPTVFETKPTSTGEIGETLLTLRMNSPVVTARRLAAVHKRETGGREVPCMKYPHDEPHRNFLRKPCLAFGWDWGPCLFAIRLHRAALETRRRFLIHNVGISQDHASFATLRSVSVTPTVSLYLSSGPAPISISIVSSLRHLDSPLALATSRHHSILSSAPLSSALQDISVDPLEIPDALLWYPRGYGPQELYELHVEVIVDGQSNSIKRLVGLRTIELLSGATRFQLLVNGNPTFLRGANVIPWELVACPSTRASRWRATHLLESAAAANFNCIRVWGGGDYLPEHFYRRCSRLGLLVLHDLMFACSLYPASPRYLEEVAREVEFQGRRLSSHPCMGLWFGNNECEEWLVRELRPALPADEYNKLCADYMALFHATIPPILARCCPGVPFWRSSPSNGAEELSMPGLLAGDIHEWNVWHGDKDYLHFASVSNARFVSEFGFQSYPSLTALQALAPDQHTQISLMNIRQRSPPGNRRIQAHVAKHFPAPSSFEQLCFFSQLLQAISVRFAVDAWRRNPNCSGAVWWQLNDVWVGPTWSSIDYTGAWKPLQYWAQHFCAPHAVSTDVDEHGVISFHLVSDPTITTAPAVGSFSSSNLGSSSSSSSLAALEVPPFRLVVCAIRFTASDRFQVLSDTLIPRRRDDCMPQMVSEVPPALVEELLSCPLQETAILSMLVDPSFPGRLLAFNWHFCSSFRSHPPTPPGPAADHLSIQILPISVQLPSPPHYWHPVAEVRVKSPSYMFLFLFLESPLPGRFSVNCVHLLPATLVAQHPDLLTLFGYHPDGHFSFVFLSPSPSAPLFSLSSFSTSLTLRSLHHTLHPPHRSIAQSAAAL